MVAGEYTIAACIIGRISIPAQIIPDPSSSTNEHMQNGSPGSSRIEFDFLYKTPERNRSPNTQRSLYIKFILYLET